MRQRQRLQTTGVSFEGLPCLVMRIFFQGSVQWGQHSSLPSDGSSPPLTPPPSDGEVLSTTRSFSASV